MTKIFMNFTMESTLFPINTYTVKELREKLVENDLSAKENKKQLYSRLQGRLISKEKMMNKEKNFNLPDDDISEENVSDEDCASCKRQGKIKNIDRRYIPEFLPEFHGNVDENITVFLEQIKELKKTYEINDQELKLIVISKLKGKAMQWFHSKPENISINLKDLLTNLRKMFDTKPSRYQLRKKLEERIWRYDESFTDYFHEKLCLAYQSKLSEEEMTEAIVDGIKDKRLEDQARSQRFECKDLLLAFSSIKKFCPASNNRTKKTSR